MVNKKWLVSLAVTLVMGCSVQEFKSNYTVKPAETIWEEISVKPRETISQLTESLELTNVASFIESAKNAGKTQLREGEKIRVHKTLGPISKLASVEFQQDSRRSIFLKPNGSVWFAEQSTKVFQEKERQFAGKVDTTLWGSAAAVGMDIQLLVRLAEVFAWAIDFSREIQKGDEWRLVAVEYVDGNKHIGWKDIQIAEIKHSGQVFQAINYEDNETKRKGFFTALGESLEKIFLKSPIKFGRVTSKFARKRFHPILLTNRPHMGVDYGAPVGTPIMCVGDGIVEFAAPSGGGGRIIKVRHNATYTTAYKHLSRFAVGIRPGKKVRQGEIIGYVGNTGLSTGPHLHFEFLKNGTFVDPQGLKFPAAIPLKVSEKNRFDQTIKSLSSLLPKWPTPDPVAIRELSSVTETN